MNVDREMPDLEDLYQEVILDHYRTPRNSGAIAGTLHFATGHNPLCGDKLTVSLGLHAGVIREIRFTGSGCAISVASASLMTEAVKGKSRGEAESLFERFHPMVTGESDGKGLGKLEVFSGVSKFPVRVKCATLAWHTLCAALEGRQETVSTE
jgi:nitrogen fixation NifU-like protein